MGCSVIEVVDVFVVVDTTCCSSECSCLCGELSVSFTGESRTAVAGVVVVDDAGADNISPHK